MLWEWFFDSSFVWNGSVSWQCTWIANLVYWFFALLGLTADYLVATSRAPRCLRQAKIQPHCHLTRREKVDLVTLSAFNMLIVSTCFCCPIYESLWNQVQPAPQRLTIQDEWSWSTELLLKMPIHVLVTETCFYSIHRAMHAFPWLYRHVHKVHHRWTAPTAAACVYAHPVEFALANVWPIYAGPMLTNAHPTLALRGGPSPWRVHVWDMPGIAFWDTKMPTTSITCRFMYIMEGYSFPIGSWEPLLANNKAKNNRQRVRITKRVSHTPCGCARISGGGTKWHLDSRKPDPHNQPTRS